MAAAGGENGAIGMARQEFAERGDAVFGRRQIIQAEFEKTFARIVFLARVGQQRFNPGIRARYKCAEVRPAVS